MLEAFISAILDPLVSRLCSLIASQTRFISEIGHDVNWLRDELQSMRSFLQASGEAKNREDQTTQTLIDQIRDVVFDSEVALEVFDLITARRQVTSSACFGFHFKSQHDIDLRIKEIRLRIDNISRRRSDYHLEIPRVEWGGNWLRGLASSPLVHHGNMIGVEKDFEQLLKWVLAGVAEMSVLTLVGMGGVGKTTLIKKIFTHRDVTRHFDRCAWIYVSQSIQLRELFSEMAKGLMEFPSEVDALSEKQLQEILLLSLQSKRYLIVFDDVWSKRFWDAIKLVLPSNELGSRIIITTRNNEVASTIFDARSCVHQLWPLSLGESWILFCNKAFGKDGPGCPEELKEIAEVIVRKCDGLPLAVVTIGGMMLRKERTQLEWRRVLGNIYKDFSNDDVGVQRALRSSYEDLPYFLKSCFLLFSVFPNDYEISRKRLIRLWVAEGFILEVKGEVIEEVAEKCLMELISRSMIQVSLIGSSGRVKACRIHDLLHQLAISIAEKENFCSIYEEHTTEIPKKACRISLQKNYRDSLNGKGILQPRSLFTFGVYEELHFSRQLLQKKLRSLRVLDLEDACLTKLPIEVGDLIHLRYLGLKGTWIKKLPKSLKNLYYLQTLDIRRTNLRKLPFSLKHLRHLRHLEMGEVGGSVRVAHGLGCLERLQVVTGLEANRLAIEEIGKLSQLKKLSIESLQGEDTISLCSSINNMGGLSSLAIFSKDDDNSLELGTLTHLSSLQKLHIKGCLERLPDWFNGIQNLTKLRLGLSRLLDDPFVILEKLRNLLFLQLYEAYKGKVVRCSKTGFEKLKVLLLTGLEELEEWNVEEGAMPCIQEMWIMSCSRLKVIPPGFEFLTTMQKLRLVSMPEDFISRVGSSPCGEDFFRVQHIPSIQVLE